MYKITYTFDTGEKSDIEVVDEHIQAAIEEMELYEKHRNRAETRRHTQYYEGCINNIETLICLGEYYLTPEQAFFHKLKQAEKAGKLRKLRRGMRKLTKPQSKLIRQVYYKNLPMTKIAESEERDVSVIRKRLKKVLGILRKEF